MKNRNYLFISIGLALLIRGIIFFQIYPDTEIISSFDQKMYIELSQYVYENWDFNIGFGSERVPLYPLFLALCKFLSDNLFVVLIIQNIIGMTSIFIAYKIGSLFSRKLAIFTAFFTAVNLNFVVESNLILTESIFYPLFSLHLFFIFQYSIKKRISDVLLAALMLGICTLIRPVTMYLPVFITIYLFFQSDLSIIDKMKHILSFFILFSLIISPWFIRNHNIYGKFGLITQGAGHIAGFVIPYVMQYEDKIDFTEAKKRSMELWKQKKDIIPQEKLQNPFDIDHEVKKFGIAYFLHSSPFSIAKAWFWGGMKNVFSPVTVELSLILKMDRTLFGESLGRTVPEQLFNFIFKNKSKAYSLLMISGIIGVLFFRFLQVIGVRNVFKTNKEILFICFLFVSYFLIISGPVGYAKYRIPIEQIFALLTAFCFVKPGDNKKIKSIDYEKN